MKNTKKAKKVDTVEIPVDKIVAAENHMTRLTGSDFDALRDNIEDYGLQRPLIVKPADSEGFYKIIDGAHRFEIVQQLGMMMVPCAIMDITEEEDFAIQCAVGNGRQLTQAHKALLAFEQHRPEILTALGENKGGRPEKPAHRAPVFAPFSITDLETRRGLRRGDVNTLGKAWNKFCPDGRATDEWTGLRGKIANGAGVGAAVAGVAGQKVTEGKTRNDPEPDKLLLEAARTLNKRMEKLAFVDWKYRDAYPGMSMKSEFYETLAGIFSKFPEEVRKDAANWIVKDWPDDEADALFKRLKSSAKGV